MISFSQVSSMAALLIRYAHKQSAKYSSMYFNFVICSIIFFFRGGLLLLILIFQKYKTLSTWNNYFIVENPSRVHTNIFQISGFFFFSFNSSEVVKIMFYEIFSHKKLLMFFLSLSSDKTNFSIFFVVNWGGYMLIFLYMIILEESLKNKLFGGI